MTAYNVKAKVITDVDSTQLKVSIKLAQSLICSHLDD